MNEPIKTENVHRAGIEDRCIGPGVWLPTPVSQRPRLELQRWRVMELPDGDRHFVGWNATEGEGRVSSKIVSFDAATGQGTTATGRVYQLQGPIGFDRDALHTWGSWIVMHGVVGARDVSEEVQALIDAAAEPGNTKGGAHE